MQKQGSHFTEIAKSIGVHKSTISRELQRNSDQRSGAYQVDLAQKKYHQRQANKPKSIRLTQEIRDFITQWIKEDYSPKQIVGYAKICDVPCVSLERIYQFIWQDKKERFGDLEIDLVIGKDHKGALLTINDRATGFLKMAYVNSKEAKQIELKTIELLEPWVPFIHTITSDNGKEFTNHKAIAEELNIYFYFSKPYHSWQRGANENLNGLIRQNFPKKSNFNNIKIQQVNDAVEKLNNRVRKRYNFLTPNEKFNEFIIQNSSVMFMT